MTRPIIQIHDAQTGTDVTREMTESEYAEWQAQQVFDYQDQRAAEYPPMTDYLDGIVKGDAAQVQTYVDACLAVKAKYPKPA